MVIIDIKTTDDKVIEIVCENAVTHEILSVLESSSKVDAYKITQNGVQCTKQVMDYVYSGYLKPSGKAIGHEENFFKQTLWHPKNTSN